jgi:hypothetical protein
MVPPELFATYSAGKNINESTHGKIVNQMNQLQTRFLTTAPYPSVPFPLHWAREVIDSQSLPAPNRGKDVRRTERGLFQIRTFVISSNEKDIFCHYALRR